MYSRRQRLAGLLSSALLVLQVVAAHAQVNEHCTVGILNRTARVRPDGSWRIDNVPANFGRVRARATCVEDGVTRTGQTDFFTIRQNTITGFNADISLAAVDPVPASLTIAASASTLTTAGATTQLSVTATLPGGGTRDLTAASSGTSYTTSNRAVATVSADGLVTAVASGSVIISALNEGALGLLRIQVILTGGDTDGDGIPDDVELANGLNPNDPADASQDADSDGLTNKQELIDLNTNPRVADTDGDGVRDGLEVQTGSNPLDPMSVNLAQALASIKVTPANGVLTLNTIVGEASRQLTVTGRLRDGTTIDLTATTKGTTYNSSDVTICTVGPQAGRVFAGTTGTCTLMATNSGFTATASVTVQTFAPTALSSIPIPGYANNVDVSGEFAYVAAGATGLQVVDVSDPHAPVIVGSRDTPGNADDVRVVGNLAYVADGLAGLQIIDVSSPTNPVIVGAVDTPGEAQDVMVSGTRAYVADGDFGLQIVDVSNPAAPRILGSVDTPGTARGVDVAGNLVLVADDEPASAVRVIDVTNPASPQLVGSVELSGAAKDLVVRNTLAYVAAFGGGLQIVDFSIPTSPRIVGSDPTDFLPQDVELSGQFALAADVVFPNAVPIADISDPTLPLFRAIVDFSPLGGYAGTGIAATSQFVYMTGERGRFVTQQNGSTGDTRLFIGQYRSFAEDTAGIPPTVRITSPGPGDVVVEEATIPVIVDATDDVAVVSVDFLVNGQVVSTGINRFNARVPVGVTSLTLGAKAVDPGGNVGIAGDVMVTVVPDRFPPTVRLTTPVSGGTVVVGSTMPITVEATDEVAVVSVDFLVNGQVVFTATTAPYQFDFTVPVGVSNLTLGARATDPNGNIGTAGDVVVNVVHDTTAPTVRITTPATGSIVRERSQLAIVVDATDDVAVASVELLVNGQVVSTAAAAFEPFTFTVPVGVMSLTLGARASDAEGNVGMATDVVVAVIPDLPPTVQITAPTVGDTVIERTTLRVAIDATDDVAVTGVELLVNGQVVGSANFLPYRFKVRVPIGVTTFTLSARATDAVGQIDAAPDVVVNVIPDPGTTAVGRIVDRTGTPVAGATVVCLGVSGLTAADGTFSLTGIPTLRGDVQCMATATISGQSVGGSSLVVPLVQGGTSTMGDIVLVGVTAGPLYTGTRLPLSFNATAVAVGDLNRDGKPDLAAAVGSSVSVFLGNGDGTFRPEQRFAVGNSPRSVAIADLNRDSNPDLVTANNVSTDVSILLGNGDGTFQAQRRFSTGGTDAEEVAVGDVNGDGIPDLVTANIRDRRSFPEDGDVTVFLGNGDGTFQPPQLFNTGGNPAAVVVADLDVDGALDFVVADTGGDAVWVFMGNGDGTFESQQTVAAGEGATALAVTDVNGDEDLDLVTANRLSGDVSVLLGNGDGTFQPQRRVASGIRPVAVVAAEINFDGKVDLAVADEAANEVRVLLGAGDGTFPTQQRFAAGNGPTAVAVGDLNGDRLPDLVTANTLSRDIFFLFHR